MMSIGGEGGDLPSAALVYGLLHPAHILIKAVKNFSWNGPALPIIDCECKDEVISAGDLNSECLVVIVECAVFGSTFNYKIWLLEII